MRVDAHVGGRRSSGRRDPSPAYHRGHARRRRITRSPSRIQHDRPRGLEPPVPDAHESRSEDARPRAGTRRVLVARTLGRGLDLQPAARTHLVRRSTGNRRRRRVLARACARRAMGVHEQLGRIHLRERAHRARRDLTFCASDGDRRRLDAPGTVAARRARARVLESRQSRRRSRRAGCVRRHLARDRADERLRATRRDRRCERPRAAADRVPHVSERRRLDQRARAQAGRRGEWPSELRLRSAGRAGECHCRSRE